jgi:hypothetical protein
MTDPYRPLFVEGDPVRVICKLTYDELCIAVDDYLINEKGFKDNGKLPILRSLWPTCPESGPVDGHDILDDHEVIEAELLDE